MTLHFQNKLHLTLCPISQCFRDLQQMIYGIYIVCSLVSQFLTIDHRTQSAALDFIDKNLPDIEYEESPYELLEMFQNKESYEKELV